ncbi:unnamed protein product [Phytophthora fragariaefolia]|uniref:Unnamed protein product n=1 Tax=Phytophthora fragariaefolia TaxID=1490495 RepID=A0A9W6Y6D3_9STRA|nr:unnamed protein product [Phytophthora fragariaefolia]
MSRTHQTAYADEHNWQTESAPGAPQQLREWNALESHVVVGADGFAASRGAGRHRSDGLSITRSTRVDSSVAVDAAVDDRAIKFTPTRVELGRMEICSPQRYYVGVENRGRVSVRLDGADFTHEGFSLATDVRGIRLDPGDRFNVQFVFLPREEQPDGVDAFLRVLTTSGLFALPISSPKVVVNRFGVSAVKASIPAGVRFGQSLEFVNPIDETIRITELYALDGFVHLELLNGSDWIGPRWPSEGDEKEVRREVPGEYDKEFDFARRTDRGAWDMPPGTTSPLIKVSLLINTPGVYFTHIHIAAGRQRLLLVPVHVTVLKPGIHIEPKELDLGVLTDHHEDKPREVFFTLFNAGVNPIDVLELKVLESNLIVSAQLWGGSTVIPPRTQVHNALAVQLRVDKGEPSGYCFASLLLKTNATSSELGQRKLKLYGQVVRGNMAFQINETRVGVILPLQNVFYDKNGANDTSPLNGTEQTIDDNESSTTTLVSIVDEKEAKGIMVGSSAFQKLRLWNQFDRPMELQRVWIDNQSPDQNASQEIAVYRYKQGVVPAGSAWPKISLQITPMLQGKGKFPTTRSYSLFIETNVTRHRIPIYVYHGFLSVDSSRGLQNHSISGYHSSSTNDNTSFQACVMVPTSGDVPTTLLRIDGGERTSNTQSVQLCRSLLFDLGKMASHKVRSEVVQITNENPVPITLEIMAVPASDIVNMSISASSHSTVGFATGLDVNSAVTGNQEYQMNLLSHPTSNNPRVVSVGDTFTLQPGDQVKFSVKIQAKDTAGELTLPVMSLATCVEVLHLYARLQSVQGTVEPITAAIIVPSMFPGRTQLIHVKYRNTFEHPVTTLMASISSPKLKLLSMRNTLAPKQVESVLDLLFSPAADSECSGALFLADCLLPKSTPGSDQTCEQLSGYGELVDEHDLLALSLRNSFWSGVSDIGHLPIVEAQVQLRTDITDDVAEVTIKALLERPLVTVSPRSSSQAPSIVFDRKVFELTELLHVSHVFVHVYNPSNVSIQMELTRAEVDQNRFYSCDDNFDDTTQEIPELCLAEWKRAAFDALVLQRDAQVDLYVPPFYFRSKVIHVMAGEEAQLGPIYYLPSKVQEVTQTIFVRNDLSHIEPVQLFAHSGKGTFALSVATPADIYTSTEARFIPRDLAGMFDSKDDVQLDFEGTLRFDVTQQDDLADYTRSIEIFLSNTGPFGLNINSVVVEDENALSWIPSVWESKLPSIVSDFGISSEYLKPTMNNSEGHSVVLNPGKTASLHISFSATCFRATSASWLVIGTSDSTKRIRLEGTITTDASFSCLRSRIASAYRHALRAIWMLAVIVAIISTLYSIATLTHDTWTFSTCTISDAQVVCQSRTEDPPTVVTSRTSKDDKEEAASPSTGNEKNGAHPTLESINCLLEDMEKTAFVPAAHVVTPAVAALLGSRHTRGFSIGSKAPNSEEDRHYQTTNGVQNLGKAVPPQSASDNGKPATVAEADMMPQSDVARMVTESGAQIDQDQVTNAVGALMMPEGTHGLVSKSTVILSKLLDDSSHHEHCDLSSDEDNAESSEQSSVASSHSTIVQPDSEDSNRTTDFPKVTFDTFGGHLKSAAGSDKSTPIGSPSPQKEEGPFEAFTSLSERWRSQDWQENLVDPPPPSLSPIFSGLEDWNGTLSFNMLGQGLVGSTRGNQHDEGASSASRSESSSFVGTGSRLFLESFSSFAGSAAPSPAPAPKGTTTKAPPGFTPADAKPLETRAAFERLRNGIGVGSSSSMAGSSSDGFGDSSPFLSNLPLFGPAGPPVNYSNRVLGGAGRIGSGRSKVLRDTDSAGTCTVDESRHS